MIQNSRDAGFYAHLAKPLDFDFLLATIQQSAFEASEFAGPLSHT